MSKKLRELMAPAFERLKEKWARDAATAEQYGLREWYAGLMAPPGGMLFTLDPEQMARLKAWTDQHKTVYTGAIGGRYTYEFTPTSVGVFLTVRDAVTKQSIDLTGLFEG